LTENIENEADKKIIEAQYRKESNNLIWVTDRRFSLIGFRDFVDRQFAVRDYDYIAVDYLSLFLIRRGMKKHEEIDLITQEFISICHDYSVPIICVQQVNDRDESRDEISLHLGNLKDSGAIEQNARQVIMLNGKRSENKREIKVVKNTGAGLASYDVTFAASGIMDAINESDD
jgi:hypothetical protein